MAITKLRHDGIINTAPIVNVYNNAAQTLTANTWTEVTLDTEVIDTQNRFGSNIFSIPDVGRYFIVATVEFNCSDTDELVRASMKLQKQPSGGSYADAVGTEQSWFKDHDSDESATRHSLTTTYMYTSAASDSWKVFAYGNNGGGTLTLQAQSCTFIAFKVIG